MVLWESFTNFALIKVYKVKLCEQKTRYRNLIKNFQKNYYY